MAEPDPALLVWNASKILCTGAAAIVGYLGMAHWIIRPLDQRAKQRKADAHFSIADFFCLFIALQAPLALIAFYQNDDPYARGFFNTLTVLAWIIGPIIWVACSRTLSKAEVTTGSLRILFLGVVLPIVFYGLFPFCLGPVLAVLATVRNDGLLMFLWDWQVITGWSLLGVALIASGLTVRWILHRSEKLNAENHYEEEKENEEEGSEVVAGDAGDART